MELTNNAIADLREQVNIAYDTIAEKGGEVPENRSLVNLPEAIGSIHTNKCAFDYYFFNPDKHYAYDEAKNYKESYESYACLVFEQGEQIIVNESLSISGVEKVIFEDGSQQDIVGQTTINIPVINNGKTTSYIHVVSTMSICIYVSRILGTSMYAYNCNILNNGNSDCPLISIALERCSIKLGVWGDGFSNINNLRELKYIDCAPEYIDGVTTGSFYNCSLEVYVDDNMPSIDNACFQNVYGLKYINTPNVRYIHNDSSLPLRHVLYMDFHNVEEIGSNVFRNIVNSNRLHWFFPKLSKIGTNCFPTGNTFPIELGTLISVGNGTFNYHYGFIKVGKDTDCNLLLNTWGYNNGLLNQSAGGDAKLMGDTIMEQLVENLKDNSQTGVTRTITLSTAIKTELGYGTESAHPLFAMLAEKNWTVA